MSSNQCLIEKDIISARLMYQVRELHVLLHIFIGENILVREKGRFLRDLIGTIFQVKCINSPTSYSSKKRK